MIELITGEIDLSSLVGDDNTCRILSKLNESIEKLEQANKINKFFKRYEFKISDNLGKTILFSAVDMGWENFIKSVNTHFARNPPTVKETYSFSWIAPTIKELIDKIKSLEDELTNLNKGGIAGLNMENYE